MPVEPLYCCCCLACVASSMSTEQANRTYTRGCPYCSSNPASVPDLERAKAANGGSYWIRQRPDGVR